MKVMTGPPVSFVNGDVLPPADLNAAWRYGKRALDDVASKQWAHGVLILPFVKDVGTAYTDSTTSSVRTIYFRAPVDCIIERAFVSANYTSDAGVHVNIYDETSGGLTPSGAASPWLRLPASADATVDATDVNPARLTLTGGHTYSFHVAPASGAMSLERFDLILHVATNRWLSAGIEPPTFDPAWLTEEDAPDADVIVGNNADLTDAAALLEANVSAPLPVLIGPLHDVLSGTDVHLRTFRLPVFERLRAQGRIVRCYLFAHISGIGSTTIGATISVGGVSPDVVADSVTAPIVTVIDSGPLDIDLGDGGPGDTEDKDEDATIILASTDASLTVEKMYALVWIDRG